MKNKKILYLIISLSLFVVSSFAEEIKIESKIVSIDKKKNV